MFFNPQAHFPRLVSIKKIWDFAPHNALTDLIRHQERWLCTFRESDVHVFGKNGVIRILESEDGFSWRSLALIEEKGVDLRDPKLSVTPDGQLMLLIGGTTYRGKETLARQSRVAFSLDAKNWSPLEKVCAPLDWLWRVTWHNGEAWGVSYRPPEREGERWRVVLYKSQEGLYFKQVVEWEILGKPNEVTLRFLPDQTMVALVRRNLSKHKMPEGAERQEAASGSAWIGSSSPPYQEWDWQDAQHHLGGPNFLVLPGGSMWAAGRLVERNPYGFFEKTALCKMDLQKLYPVLILPSGGDDTSYPGMVYHEEKIWMSYYSSHEERTSIYFAQVAF